MNNMKLQLSYITGYQFIVYRMSSQMRFNNWTQYVSPPGRSPVDSIKTIIQQLNLWDRHWSEPDRNTRIDIEREKQIKNTNLSQ